MQIITSNISNSTTFASTNKPMPSLIQSLDNHRNIATSAQALTKSNGSISFANKLGRLVQGAWTRMPSGTNTIFFIKKHAVPKGQVVTYNRIVCIIRPQKTEPNNSRLIVGGNCLTYTSNIRTLTPKITTAKCLLSSAISTFNARFTVGDIKDFYLNTSVSI
jgi:hypothetical protein